MAWQQLSRWTRNCHLYFGLFISPFVLMYAVSVVLLNHAYLPWSGSAAKPEPRTVAVSVQNSDNGLDVAQQVQRQIGVRGEIGFINRARGGTRVNFPIETPVRTTNVRVDLTAGTATIEPRETGVWNASIYLHKMPGPHNANIRGNWVIMRAWGWLADITVYLLLFLTVSGFYLWTLLKADRRAGLAFMGAGMISLAVILIAIVA
jgi:hypothetical protein